MHERGYVLLLMLLIGTAIAAGVYVLKFPGVWTNADGASSTTPIEHDLRALRDAKALHGVTDQHNTEINTALEY